MEELNKLLKSVHDRAIKAAERIQMLENENLELKRILKESQEQLEIEKSELSQLHRQIEMMKIAGGLESDKSDRSSKQKIAELVREIDHCITLLK